MHKSIYLQGRILSAVAVFAVSCAPHVPTETAPIAPSSPTASNTSPLLPAKPVPSATADRSTALAAPYLGDNQISHLPRSA